MEQDKVLHSMAKFDLHAPTNVKIVLEDFSDEDSQDKQKKNDVLKLDPNDKQNKAPTDNNPNVDGRALTHFKVNKSECSKISSFRAKNSTEIKNNNIIDGNGSIEDEKGKISEDDFNKAWSSIEELLMSASKHFIIILIAYNKYSKVKDSRESKEVMSARNHYLFIKHLSFKIIYHIIISVLLPEENNSGFINDFINNTLKIANKIPDISCTHSQLEIIYRELLEWAKQKETLESNKKKNSNIQNVIQGIPESNLTVLNSNKEINPKISSRFEGKTYENNVLAESSYKEISLNIDSILDDDEKLKAYSNGTSAIQEKSKNFTFSSEPQISDERVARLENFKDRDNIITFVSNSISSHSASQTFTHKEKLGIDKNINIIGSKESNQSNNDHINHQLPVNSWYFTPGRNNPPCQNIASKGIEKKLQHQNTLFERAVNTTFEKRNHAQKHETFANSPQQLNIHTNNCQTNNIYPLNYPPSTVPVQPTYKTNLVLQKEKANSSLNRYSIEKKLNHIYNNSNQYPASENIINTETILNQQQLQYKYPELTRHIQSNAIHFENHYNLPGSFPMTSYNYNNHNYNNQSVTQINESITHQPRSERRNFFQPYSHRPPCTNRPHIIQSEPPPYYSDTLQKRAAAANNPTAVVHLEPSINRPNHFTIDPPTIPQTPFYEFNVRNENDGSIADDRTRSTSTDSGFVSPLNTNIIPENLNYTSIESCSPLITHVTSLNPNAAQNCTGSCHVCRKGTKTKCLGCYKVYYCSVDCQDIDWLYHMQQCEYFKLATK